MRESWYALFVAVERGCLPEHAFELLERPERPGRVFGRDEDVTMAALHAEGYTYREIGDLYGMSRDAVHHRVQQFLEQQQERGARYG